ncbi:MAG TPA: hypothetical protein VMW19_19485 [Myxococcota bacterium]|nr:hypothetical protein [Myxococcota bacterium]
MSIEEAPRPARDPFPLVAEHGHGHRTTACYGSVVPPEHDEMIASAIVAGPLPEAGAREH